jgi:hypothetical protein
MPPPTSSRIYEDDSVFLTTVTFDENVVVSGNLTVNGTTTTINSSTLQVDDKNIVLGETSDPSDATANGGGITLMGSTDKTFNWESTTSAWTSSENINLASGKQILVSGNAYYAPKADPTFSGTVDATGATLNAGTLTATKVAISDNSNKVATTSAVKDVTDPLAPKLNPAFIGTVTGISKGMVGLGNVDNESKATMFTNPTFTGTVDATDATLNAGTLTATKVAINDNSNKVATTSAVKDVTDPLAPKLNPAFIGTVTGISKGMVGLGNVDNESKATMFTDPAFTGTVTGVSKGMVGLGNVDNESKATMFTNPIFSGTVDATNATLNAAKVAINDNSNKVATTSAVKDVTDPLAPKANPIFTGTVTGVSKGMVGLGNVDNESKATMFTNPTFSGNVTGVSKGMVGLGNVDNESKATMFTNPTFSGTVTGVSKGMVGLGNVDNESKATMFTNPIFSGTVDATNATLNAAKVAINDNSNKVATTSAVKDVTDPLAPKSNPTFTGTVNAADLILSGNLTVNGTTTTIKSSTLDVADKNITLGMTSSPSDATANGGGITIKGSTDKTFNWESGNDGAWNSSENINLASGKQILIDGVAVHALKSNPTFSGTVDATNATLNAAKVAISNNNNSVATTSAVKDVTDTLAPLYNPIFTGTVDATGATFLAAKVAISNNNNSVATTSAVKDVTDTLATKANPTIANPTFLGAVDATSATFLAAKVAINDNNNSVATTSAVKDVTDTLATKTNPIFTGTVDATGATLNAAKVAISNNNNSVATTSAVKDFTDTLATKTNPIFTGTVDATGATLNAAKVAISNNNNSVATTSAVKDVTDPLAPKSNPTFTGTVNAADLILSGNLTVNGTTTTIASSTLDVADKNITLGITSSPSDATANGGGITLKGSTDKTFNWESATNAWTSSENINLASGKKLLVSGDEIYAKTTHPGFTPIGGIIMWSGSTSSIPQYWSLCDGQNGTPDLRNKFILGASETKAVHSTGGTSTLTVNHMPSHSHNLSVIDYGHSHSISDWGHHHNVTDPGHIHTSVRYPGYGGDQRGMQFSGYQPLSGVDGHAYDNTSTATTGIGIQTSYTGIQVNTSQTRNLWASADYVGSGQEYLPPHYVLAYIMRTS